MCGIAGIFHCGTPKPVEPHRVERMCDAIAHRGPDGSGVWTAPGVGLGHRRLSIIDLEGSPQPMHSPDGRAAIVFNGEIYNFCELRRELERKGAKLALLTTEGHRDVLELRRSVRIDLYDLEQDPPPVIIPRQNRFEITERVDAQGDVVTPLDESEIPALVEKIKASGAQTVAVSFLFSFLNPAHEQRVGALLREERS